MLLHSQKQVITKYYKLCYCIVFISLILLKSLLAPSYIVISVHIFLYQCRYVTKKAI